MSDKLKWTLNFDKLFSTPNFHTILILFLMSTAALSSITRQTSQAETLDLPLKLDRTAQRRESRITVGRRRNLEPGVGGKGEKSA